MALTTAVLMLSGVAVAAGCGSDAVRRDGSGNALGAAVSIDRSTTPPSAPVRTPGTLTLPRAQLQSTLASLFEEHVQLVLATTEATIAGDASAASEARAKLDKNSDDIVGAIVGVYGPDAAIFGQGWRMHVQAFVDDAAAGGSRAPSKSSDARGRLEKYPKQVGAFLASANPNLTEQGVADLIAEHIADVLALIDQQVAGSATTVDTTHAAEHMGALATALTDAIARQFPDRFA